MDTPSPEAPRVAALRRMKTLALALALLAAIIFTISFVLQTRFPPLAYVRAAAEGAMVGALADWFAVTALFRRPLGLPIPHTALIPHRKDALGASLTSFVEENFLTETAVRDKVQSQGLAQRVGRRMQEPGGSHKVGEEAARLAHKLVDGTDDTHVRHLLETLTRHYILAPAWGPPTGLVLEALVSQGRHRPVVDILLERADQWVGHNRSKIVGLVAERSPSWVPSFIEGVVADRVYEEIRSFVGNVRTDPAHSVRQSIDEYLTTVASDLQNDDEMIARFEGLKTQLLESEQVRQALSQLGQDMKERLLAALDDPTSSLRRTLVALAADLGRRLNSDPDLGSRVNARLTDFVADTVNRNRAAIASIITDTVARWDGDDASRRIELHVGRDLQFIRINGTFVGALAGMGIFTLARLLLPG